MKIDKKKYRKLVNAHKNRLEISFDNYNWEKCTFIPNLNLMQNPVIIFTKNKFIEIIGARNTIYLRIN
jgi:hypothetical protein